MGETARRHSDLLDRGGKGIGLDRLLFFSDAVFAIAITLLVVDLGVQTIGANGEELSTAVIGQEILDSWSSYLAYLISFTVIGFNWTAHHRNLSVLVRYDTGVVWLNLLVLMFVAFLPFPTRTMFEGDGRLSHPQFALYTGTVAAIGLAQALLWFVVGRKGYLDPDRVDDKLHRFVLLQSMIPPAVFGLSFVVEFTLGSPWSLAVWGLQIPANIVAAHYEPRDRPPRGRVSRNRG